MYEYNSHIVSIIGESHNPREQSLAIISLTIFNGEALIQSGMIWEAWVRWVYSNISAFPPSVR